MSKDRSPVLRSCHEYAGRPDIPLQPRHPWEQRCRRPPGAWTRRAPSCSRRWTRRAAPNSSNSASPTRSSPACCATASACRASPSSRRASESPSSPRVRRSRACATRVWSPPGAVATAAASSPTTGTPRAACVDARLRDLSRIELRDLALHTAAIAGTAAEVAADRASDDDLETLQAIADRADVTTAGGARRAVGRFQLEVAAVSQSPRLVHEELRLQAEAGPLLWLCLREQEYRDLSASHRAEIIRAIRDVAPAAARAATVAQIDAALGWLVDEKLRLEASAAELRTARRHVTTDRGGRTVSTTTMAPSAIADFIAETIDPVFATIDAWRDILETELARHDEPTAALVDPIISALVHPALARSRPHHRSGIRRHARLPRRRAVAPRVVARRRRLARPRRRASPRRGQRSRQRGLPRLHRPRVVAGAARTGTRHLTGPYVDYVCTDDYTITVTTPVRVDGEMVGVVGTDALRGADRAGAPPVHPRSRCAVRRRQRIGTHRDRDRVAPRARFDAADRRALRSARSAARAESRAGRDVLPGGQTVLACGDTSLAVVMGI